MITMGKPTWNTQMDKKMNIKSGREQKPTAQAYISQTKFTKALQGAIGTSLNKIKKENQTPLKLLLCFSYLFFTQISLLTFFSL